MCFVFVFVYGGMLWRANVHVFLLTFAHVFKYMCVLAFAFFDVCIDVYVDVYVHMCICVCACA